jgi:hypothetical protein
MPSFFDLGQITSDAHTAGAEIAAAAGHVRLDAQLDHACGGGTLGGVV